MTQTEWLNEPKAATMLGISLATLRRMRDRGEGPPYYRIGRKTIRYRLDDVERYLEEQRREPQRDPDE